MNVNMTQEQIVRELRSGLPIHTHPGDPEPRLSPLSVSCVHAIMSTAANLIETLAADRESAMQEASDFLKEINEAQSKIPRWISVEERLPGKGTVVLVMWHGEMAFARYTPHRLGWYNLDTRYDSSNAVSHWMPLPDPPKEE